MFVNSDFCSGTAGLAIAARRTVAATARINVPSNGTAIERIVTAAGERFRTTGVEVALDVTPLGREGYTIRSVNAGGRSVIAIAAIFAAAMSSLDSGVYAGLSAYLDDNGVDSVLDGDGGCRFEVRLPHPHRPALSRGSPTRKVPTTAAAGTVTPRTSGATSSRSLGRRRDEVDSPLTCTNAALPLLALSLPIRRYRVDGRGVKRGVAGWRVRYLESMSLLERIMIDPRPVV